MNVLYLAAGLLIYGLTTLDIIKTAFSSRGAGRFTQAASRLIWSVFFAAARRRGRSRLLEYAGLSVLAGIITLWICGLWLGLWLVLMSDPSSVVASATRIAATPLEKLYYAGFTLSTLGVGDYQASGDGWRLVTGLAAFSGLVFITTAITYFVPVLSAVSLQNKLSLYISAMGRTPQEMLTNSWGGEDFEPFYSNVPNLCEMLMEHAMNHHAYPVIHQFHTSDPQLTIAPAIVRLDEACQLLTHAVDSRCPERRLALNQLRTTLDAYLAMIGDNFLGQREPHTPPPEPDLQALRAASIPLQEAPLAAFTGEPMRQRRRLLSALLESDGWGWEDVYGAGRAPAR